MATESDFTIGIGADLKNFLGGIKQAKNSFGTLGRDASKAIKTPQADLEQLSKQLQTFAGVAKGALAGFAGAMGIKSLTMDFMNFHANLSNAVQVMGYDVSNVEAIGGAMRRFGGDTSGAISSLDNLSNALQQARWGQGALVETAQKFGISFMKNNGEIMNSEELLRSLSSQLNQYDSYTKKAIASSLGLDDALLRVIDTGNFSQLIDHQKQLNKTTKEDLKVATDFESAWLDLKDTFASFAKQVSLIIIPPLTKLLKYIQNLMMTFNDLKSKTTIAWGAIGISTLGVVAKMGAFAKTVMSLVSGFSMLKGASGVLGTIGGALKSLMSPLKLVSLAFGAIFMVIEDLYVYSKGGKSMFGELEKQFPVLEGLGSGIKAAFEHISKTIDSIITFFKDPSWANFYDIIKPQIDLMAKAFYGLFDWIKSTAGKIGEWILDGIRALPGGEMILKGLSAVKSGIGSAIDTAVSGAGSLVDKVKGYFTGGDTPPVLPASAQAAAGVGGNQFNNQQNNNITINAPSGDAKAIAGEVKDVLSSPNMTGFYQYQ